MELPWWDRVAVSISLGHLLQYEPGGREPNAAVSSRFNSCSGRRHEPQCRMRTLPLSTFPPPVASSRSETSWPLVKHRWIQRNHSASVEPQLPMLLLPTMMVSFRADMRGKCMQILEQYMSGKYSTDHPDEPLDCSLPQYSCSLAEKQLLRTCMNAATSAGMALGLQGATTGLLGVPPPATANPHRWTCTTLVQSADGVSIASLQRSPANFVGME